MATFDFTAGALPGGATLTRASAARYFDEAGVMQAAGANVARFDHDPVTRQPVGLLLEPSAGNANLYSDDFSNAVWDKGGVTIPAANAVSETAVGVALHRLAQFEGIAEGVDYSTSIIAADFANYEQFRKRYLSIQGDNGASGWATFDLTAGTFIVGGGATASMQALGGGRWRCSLHNRATSSGGGYAVGRYITDQYGPPRAYIGDENAGLRMWSAQRESGVVPSSYIPTTGAAGARAADLLSLDCTTQGLGDGLHAFGVVFDDQTTQILPFQVASGIATINAAILPRPHVLRIFTTVLPATPAGRTLTLTDAPPSKVYAFAQAADPTDIVDFQAVLSQGADPAFLQTGEAVTSYTLALTAEAIAAGLMIRSTSGYATTLADNVIRFWLSVDAGYAASPIFKAPGTPLALELTATTNTTPPRVKQRTLLVTVANQ